MPTDLKTVVLTIHENFPDDPHILRAALTGMSTIACLQLNDLPHCIGLNFVGQPASAKTTVLDFFDTLSMVHKTDDFTPASFVSHYAGRTTDELSKIDLLPRIKGKCILIPELAPLFSARHEDLMKKFGTITRVFDGRGFESESGVHGHRGYSGDDFLFAWLGATTPLPQRAWEVMGKLGSRLVFFDMGPKLRSPDDLAKMLASGSYRQKVDDCRYAVKDFMEAMWEKQGGFRGVPWDTEADSHELLVQIGELASAVAKWRGVIQREDDSGFNPPQIEQPERLAATFYCLARGFALINGRRELADHDIEMLKPIAHSSMPEDRRRIYEALRKHSMLSTGDVLALLKCSDGTAAKVMRELKALGVVWMKESPSGHLNGLA